MCANVTAELRNVINKVIPLTHLYIEVQDNTHGSPVAVVPPGTRPAVTELHLGRLGVGVTLVTGARLVLTHHLSPLPPALTRRRALRGPRDMHGHVLSKVNLQLNPPGMPRDLLNLFEFEGFQIERI